MLLGSLSSFSLTQADRFPTAYHAATLSDSKAQGHENVDAVNPD